MTCPRILTLLSLALCIVYSTAQGACPGGYTQENGRCYKLFTTPATFNEARITCQGDGGELVSVPDQGTHDWLVSTFLNSNEFIYIGYTDAAKEGTWVWADGTTSSFSSWGIFGNRQLPDIDNKFNCAGMSTQLVTPGDWLDGICTESKPFICSRTKVSWSCGPEFKLYGDKCYRLIKGRKTWEDARVRCVFEGTRLGKVGTLASVPDQGTQDFITTNLMAGKRWSPWIGLSDSASEGTWVWTDGTAFSYSQWTVLNGVQQPLTSSTTNCAAIEGINRGLFGEWNDFKCTMLTWSVCQVGANEVV